MTTSGNIQQKKLISCMNRDALPDTVDGEGIILKMAIGQFDMQTTSCCLYQYSVFLFRCQHADGKAGHTVALNLWEVRRGRPRRSVRVAGGCFR
jgi:hypothetical protein